MSRGDCGDLLSFSELYSLQTNTSVAAEGCCFMLKVMKQSCQGHVSFV